MQTQDQQIKIIKVIGKGSYGEVFLCEDQLGHQIALKAIKRNLLDDKFQNSYKTELNALKKLQIAQNKTTLNEIDPIVADEADKSQAGSLSKRSMSFDQEMCFLKEQNSQLLCQDHEVNVRSNIIQFVKNIDSYSFQFNNKTYSCHALFIEYAKNGCLGNFLDSPKLTFLPINIVRRIAKQLFQVLKFYNRKQKRAIHKIGIEEMHAAHLVHRDIKEDNIVFAEGFTVKLIDLSFAGRNDNEVCGTQKYISPEILKQEVQMQNENQQQGSQQQAEQKNVSREQRFQRFAKVDTFAAGVVLFRLATKVFPFGSASQFDYKYKHIVSKQYDQFWSNVNFIVSNINVNNPDVQFNQFLHNRQIKEETLQDLDTSSNSLHSDSAGDEESLQDNQNSGSGNQSAQEETLQQNEEWSRNKDCIMKRSQKKIQTFLKSKRAVSQINCFITPNEQAYFQQLISQEEKEGAPNYQVEQKEYELPLAEQIEQLKDLIQYLLAYDVDERYGVQEALNHPFLQQDHKQYASSKDLQSFFAPLIS